MSQTEMRMSGTTADNGEETDADLWDAVSFVTCSYYRQATLGVLDDGPATPSEIAKALGCDIALVSRALGEMRQRQLVDLLVSDDTYRGRYHGLTSTGKATIGKIQDDLGG